MSKKLTKEEFIKKAREKHGDKYNYDKVEYVNNRTKVCIICPKHGEFWQQPNNHLNGNGCPKCGGTVRLSKEEFIKKANEAHQGKYDYSKVEYKDAHTKVCIICSNPEHGEFWQSHSNHLSGKGCPKCANESNGERKRLSKEDFIKRSNEVHEGKYNYDKVNYVNNNTKVRIICPNHGEFWQSPSNHLSGKGCPKCMAEANGDRKRLTKEDFIKRSNEVHEGKYNYYKVDYKGSKTKVCIICPNSDHGEFWQRPSNHLSGNGCPKCGNKSNGDSKRSSKEEFIKNANEVHEDKYNYDKVEYVDVITKVSIICPKHGEFWQTPSSHTQGHGCPKCANETTGDNKRLSKEEFIKKSNEKHEGKYDYYQVKYVNCDTKVCIICPEHGEFEQTPASHIKGAGCPKCKGDKARERLTSTTENFIKKARLVHGDKYDYSKVDYVNNRTKVCIICPQHGKFEQIPNKHLMGKGCPKCNLSHLERSVMMCLDDIGITYDYQKRFKWLGLQSLDFYLPDYNVGIECQGRQHFFPVEYFGGDKGFKKTLERDKRKKALCEKHDIKLLYFGNVPNCDTLLGEKVHDDVQYIIEYLNEYEKKKMIVK